MGIILQQLGSQGRLNHLFVVEVREMDVTQSGEGQAQCLAKSILKPFEKHEDLRLKRRRQDLWDVSSHWQLVEQPHAIVDEENNQKDTEEDNDL